MSKTGGMKFRLNLSIILFCFLSAGAFAADKAFLAKTVFAPADTPHTLLTVKERGYYSLSAKSRTGTAIELVDRMAGVIGAYSGAPGKRDGRIDLLLDPGEYRVNLRPDPDVKTPSELAVLPFHEANPGATIADYPFLYDGDSIKTDLGDLETRSYWIYLPARAELRLELLGRSLKTCALWQNGQWLMNVQPDYTEREPVKGRTMLWAEFHKTLDAGHYLLVCAGGPRRAWADESQESSLYIRRGARFLGSNGVQKLRVSPFGRDAYLIAGTADYAECDRDNLSQTRLGLGSFNADRNRYDGLSYAEITKQSKEPYCRVMSRNTSEKKWLVVEAAPGDLLEVSFFKRGASVNLPYDRDESKSYWVSTAAGYAGRDLIDLTPLLYYRNDKHIAFIKEGAVRVSGPAPFIRKVNLLGANTVHLFVEEPGTYRIAEDSGSGGKAKYRFSLLETRFIGGTTGEYKTPDKTIDLLKGYYILDLQPASLGILHFALYKDGSGKADELLKRDPPDPRYAFSWGAVNVPAETTVTYAANARFDLPQGVDVRELPLALSMPLSVLLQPGESIETRVTVEKDSLLYVEGDKYSLNLSGKKTENEASLTAGAYSLSLMNDATSADLITLYTKDKLSLQRFPKPVLAAFEDTFPVFTESRPYYADFDRGQTRNVLLRVTEPALYRIETAGRLALALSVRTPLVPALFSADENGAGRNALVVSYLRPGDYLIAVSAQGRSRGRAGLYLKKTPFTEEGFLPPDVVSRETVEADIGLRYTVTAEAKAKYAIGSLGLDVAFPFRFEDSDGFPLKTGSTSATLALEPGDYHYYSLPVAFTTRRLTSFTKLPEPAGPAPETKSYTIALNSPQARVWKETNPRANDIFTLSLPAALTVSVSLSSGMEGELKGGALSEPVPLLGGQNRALDLAAGAYVISVRTQEIANLFGYALSVATDTLAAGLEYPLGSELVTFSVSAGGDNVYDLWSSGTSDFKASLWDETGTRLLASNDDMPNDWNFRITQRLPAGRYLLRAEPAGRADGEATVAMAVNRETPLAERKLPFTVEQSLGKEILKMPVKPDADGVFAVRAEKGRAVKFGLYRDADLIAEGEDFLAVPLYKNRAYTLQIWQREDRPQPVKVTASLTQPKEFALPSQAGAVDCPPFLALTSPTGASAILTAPEGSLLYSPGREFPCRPVAAANGAWIASAPGERGYLVTRFGGTQKNVRLAPAVIVPDAKATVFLTSIPHSFLCDTGSADLWLIAAETQDRAGGLSLAPRSAYAGDRFDFRGMDDTDNKTFLLLPALGQAQGKVWNPEAAGPGRADQRVDLLLRRFPAVTGRVSKGDVQTYALAPGRGVRLDLDAGAQLVRLLLAKGCAASIWQNGTPQAMAAADSENRDIAFNVSGGVLAVVNYGAADAVVRVSVSDAAGTPVAELGAAGFETKFSGEGRLLLKIGTGHEKESLCLAGDGFSARLLGADGRITNIVPGAAAADIALLSAAPGDLQIDYTGGWLRAFFAKPGAQREGLVSRSSGAQSKPIANTAEVIGKESVFTFTMNADGFAAIASDAPGVIALYANGRVLDVRAAVDNAPPAIVYRLAKGSYEIFSRPIALAPQAGLLRLTRLTAVELSGKNEDKEYFIGRGETQVYSFEVKEAGQVGIGLRAEAESLSAALFDANSKLIGQGGLIIRPLDKGTYYLAVFGGERPVRYTPVLYGLEGSVAGIPPDIVRQYQNSPTPNTEEGAEE